MTNDKQNKGRHEPSEDISELTSPQNLCRIVVGVLAYSILQACSNSFNGRVNWFTHPDMSTVNDVLMSMEPAILLGTIRGVILALMTVTIVLVGPRVWSVIGPVLGAATRNSVHFIRRLSITVRTTGNADANEGPPGTDSKK